MFSIEISLHVSYLPSLGRSFSISCTVSGGDIYVEFLNAELPNLFEDIPLLFCANGWFQHEGAPPHFSRQVREILDRQYLHRWIGCGGPRQWPAQSPDLNPLDFFLWGYVKNIVYRSPIATEEQRRGCVQEAFATITPEMVTNSKLSLLQLAQLCLQMNGGHFKHFF
jgi:hypothetical protein